MNQLNDVMIDAAADHCHSSRCRQGLSKDVGQNEPALRAVFHGMMEENREHVGRYHKQLPAFGKGTEWRIQQGVVGAEVDDLVRNGHC